MYRCSLLWQDTKLQFNTSFQSSMKIIVNNSENVYIEDKIYEHLMLGMPDISNVLN